MSARARICLVALLVLVPTCATGPFCRDTHPFWYFASIPVAGAALAALILVITGALP